jgi:hypothetical protein
MFQNEFPLDPRHVGVTSVAPKWFLNLWYIRRKSCTYLASSLILPPNKLKRYSTWSTPRRSTIWCAQSDFRAYGTFGANHAAIFASRLILYPNKPKWAFTWPMSPRSTTRCAWKDFHARYTFGANRAPILRRELYYLQTVWNVLPLHQCHQKVPTSVPKKIYMPMVHLAHTVHLCFT